MKKFFLGTFFSYNKLNIIDEEYVIVAVLLTESRHSKLISILTDLQSVDQFIGKRLAGYIENFFGGVLFKDVMGNGMHQMRLSKSYASVYKKRVVDISGRFRNCKGCSMCKVIIASDHKGVEGIFLGPGQKVPPVGVPLGLFSLSTK